VSTTIHLLAVSHDLEPGWAVRARHLHQKKKLDRLVRAGVPTDGRELVGTVWFVSNEYSIELREILADVHHGDEIRFCERCEQSEPCQDVWSRRMLDGAGFMVGDARSDPHIFDELEEMIAWFETHRPPPSPRSNPNGGMSQADAAKLLGLTLPTTNDQVDVAFKQAAMRNHPDRGGSNEAMAKIIQARAVLRGAP